MAYDTSFKYMTRIDHKGRHGWYVRVPKNFKKDPTDCYPELFSDSSYSDSEESARRFRDRFLKKTGQLYLLEKGYIYTARNRPPITTSRNTSGITGVARGNTTKVTTGGNISKTYFWKAHGHKDEKNWSRSFAIIRFGEKEAFKMACHERFKKHGPLLVVGRIKDLPCKIPVPYVKIKKKRGKQKV